MTTLHDIITVDTCHHPLVQTHRVHPRADPGANRSLGVARHQRRLADHRQAGQLVGTSTLGRPGGSLRTSSHVCCEPENKGRLSLTFLGSPQVQLTNKKTQHTHPQ